MKLSKVERWILSNHFRILERLDPDGNDWEKAREIVEKGYEKHYAWISDYIYDDVFSEEQCSFVFDVLTMYESIQRAHDDLGVGSGLSEHDEKFHGFDGNHETMYVAYCRFLRDREERYEHLRLGFDEFNSHSPRVTRYHEMLARWRDSTDQNQLTREDLVRIFER